MTVYTHTAFWDWRETCVEFGEGLNESQSA